MICAFCQLEVYNARNGSKYCTSKCRVYGYRSKQKNALKHHVRVTNDLGGDSSRITSENSDAIKKLFTKR